MTAESNKPGEAAYMAWMLSWGHEQNNLNFDTLPERDKIRWNDVADAVIRSAKTIIAQEMVKATLASQIRSKHQPN